VPAVDPHAGTQAPRPERVVLEDVADALLVVGLDDPQPAERLVAGDLAQRSRHEDLVLAAVQELLVAGKQFLPLLGDVRLVLELDDEQHAGTPSVRLPRTSLRPGKPDATTAEAGRR
jgi:hypothetical protein